MKFQQIILSAAFALFSLSAFAVPATIEVTIMELSHDGTGGAPDSYNVYLGCNLAAQTTGSVLATNALVGQVYTFQGDTDNTYTACAVPVNEAGSGGFENIQTLSFENVKIKPGKGRVGVSCGLGSGVLGICRAL